MAFRWVRDGASGRLASISHVHGIALEDLLHVDRQKADLVRNTQQFVKGLPANNALLWGARGTGKSSLIKALLGQFAVNGLRLVQVDKEHLVNLPEIVEVLYDRPERFVLFTDDLSFDANERGFTALKAALDGSLYAVPENVLVYATSNRRHLLPEYFSENLAAQRAGEEIHQGEAVEERLSLSERFGLWLPFHPFDQDQYLDVVRYWLRALSGEPDHPIAREQALRFALQRGSRSGRVAYQFACDWAGRTAL